MSGLFGFIIDALKLAKAKPRMLAGVVCIVVIATFICYLLSGVFSKMGGRITIASNNRDMTMKAGPHSTNMQAGPNSTNIQSGPNATIIIGGTVQLINPGTSETKTDEELANLWTAMGSQLLSKYPAGCALFGIADGQIVPFEPRISAGIKLDVDWSTVRIQIDEEHQLVSIMLPDFRVLHLNPPGDPFHAWGNGEMKVPFRENEPVESDLFPGLFWEVIDAQKKIFVVGFK